MSEWRYNNPVEIHFGPGIIDNLSEFVSGKAVLVTTPGTTRRGISRKISKLLGTSLVALFDKVEPNPTFETITAAYRELKQLEYDFIIAVGGGSAIDTAKAVAALAALESDEALKDNLKEGVDIPEDFDPRSVIAIPTTAGTGSEVTMWATIWDMEEKKKYSLSHPKLYSKIAIVDPCLTLTLPERETVYSGLDAFSHAMEAIWNKNHNPVSDTLALKAISLVYDYLPELRHDLGNIDLRTSLLRASLFAGLAFSNTKTALAHSISYPLTAHFNIPHGLACVLPLPHLLELNSAEHFERIKIMSEALRADATVKSMKNSIKRLFTAVGVSSSFADYRISRADIDTIANESITSERANNNIADIDKSTVKNLVKKLFYK